MKLKNQSQTVGARILSGAADQILFDILSLTVSHSVR